MNPTVGIAGVGLAVKPVMFDVYFHENGSFFTIPVPPYIEYALWAKYTAGMLPVPNTTMVSAYDLKHLIDMAIAGDQAAYDALDKAGKLPASIKNNPTNQLVAAMNAAGYVAPSLTGPAYGAPLKGQTFKFNNPPPPKLDGGLLKYPVEQTFFLAPEEVAKCECGSEKTYGKGATHSSWCPKA